MATPTFTIPERTSSKFAIEQKSIILKNSKLDLKRKLSSTSIESSPIEYRRLKIEDLSVDLEEQKLHKTWLDIEHAEQKLTDKSYRSAHRSTNQRIISIGDDLWKERQGLQRIEEQAGKTAPIGPDAKGAFIFTLLALYKDPNVSAKRSSAVQTEMRRSSIAKYESEKDAPKGKLWCPISRDYYDAANMKAAHIIPRSLGPGLVDYVFGPGTCSRLDKSDNCLIIHKSVERLFDNGCFVLLPANLTESPIKTWKIQMTNLSAQNSDMGRKFLADLDGERVMFKNENRPAARFLYYHFVVTLLRNKRDRQPGWEIYCVELPTGKPFATPGRYLRQSMLLTLAKSAGDLDVVDEAVLLGEPGRETFVEEEKLEEREELEIGRRIFVAHGKGKNEEGEEGDDEGDGGDDGVDGGDEESSDGGDEDEVEEED